MASSYTTNHNLEKPAEGEQSGSWGDTINSNMDIIDSAIKTSLDSITITANNSTDETVYPVFVDGATGSQGLESDTGLTYNPSSGVLTSTSFTGAVTGNVTGNASGSSGSCTGNAATATTLATARDLGGVSFNGSASINLPGVNTSGNQDTSGNAATATLATSITASANNSTDETVYPTFVDGATGTQGLETDTGLSYNPSTGVLTTTSVTGNLTGNVTGNTSGSSGSCTGNAATATALATGRTIGGVSFDGTGNINLPGVNTAGNQATSGTAATATALASARTIGGVSFDGTGNINLPGVNTAGNQATSGNAATATALASARTLGGVSFDGTGNIDLPGVNTSGNQDTSGTAALATSVTASANNSTDETVYLTFVDGATGTQGIETDTGLSYNPSSGIITATQLTGNLSGNVSGGAITATGASTITTSDNLAGLKIISTDADASSGPQLDFYRNSASPAVNDYVGRIKMIGRNDNSQDFTGVDIYGRITDETDGTEDMSLFMRTMVGGAMKDRITMSSSTLILNENAADIDLRVETTSQASALLVDAGADEIRMAVPLRIGNGAANAADFLLKGNVTPSPAVGGSTKAAVISTNGTGSSAFHVGFEIPSNDTSDGFFISTDADQDGTVDTVAMKIKANGYMGILKTAPSTALDVSGTITGDTKSFSIPHPLASKVETHKLIHGSVEAPRYDLIYRGKVTLESGAASVNIDTVSSMTEGTLVALCRDLQAFTTNESGWTAIKSSLSGNTLSIEAQDNSCTDEISWMVIGERKDPNVVSADLTDNTGRIIVEMPLPEEEEILGED